MFPRLRCVLCCAGIGLVVPTTGCAVVPRSRLIACQCYNRELQQKNQQLLAQYENLKIHNQELADKSLDAEDRLAEQQELIAGFQKRLAEHQDEMGRVRSLASSFEGSRSPLPRDVRRKLEDFGLAHPDFVEVDPEAGISKFNSEVLFRSGEALLNEDAKRVLHEFASIFQGTSAQPLKIMVVGHADEKPVVRRATKELHKDNWYLSAHRAVAVVEYLQEAGIDPRRMGGVEYGPYQPIAPGRTPDALAKNRRVEIWVLAPEAPIVGRTDLGDRF